MSRTRLDVALVERGMVDTRARAQAHILAGEVRVNGEVARKAGTPVRAGDDLALAVGRVFVSRAGHKLAHALDAAELDVTGVDALDVGASTGGFTDCLLQRGAARVACVDVGYGQLAWSLRSDPRVTVVDRTNARHLRPEMLPFRPDFVTIDVSFISLTLIWPAVVACCAPGWRACVMVKPQFEVGREGVGSGGVVRDPALRRDAVERVCQAILDHSGAVVHVADSGLAGPKGNREVFVVAEDAATATTVEDWRARVEAAVAEGAA